MHKEPILYGDGIHDDTAAIQAMIDSGVCEVSLPAPQKFYLISKPLTLPSRFKLKLPRFAEIQLADGANCFMVQNKAVPKPAKRLAESLSPDTRELWKFTDLLSPDAEDCCHDFEIEGGIWNFNNKKQDPNPIYLRNYDERNYLGHGMFFYNVRNFRLSNMTLKDPVNYAIMIDTGSYFTIENLDFDFNDGNPIASNMDGVHLNGNCHYGVIRNLKGACYDDLVALNAHEGSAGPITHMDIDGIFAEGCHSAVRLLTVAEAIEHIRIANVHGSYYQYCIGFTKYYPGETTGYFDCITLSNICAVKANRLPIQEAHMGDKSYSFPFLWIQGDTRLRHMTVDGVHRREYVNPVETIHIGEKAVVENLTIRDLTLENHTAAPCAKFVNHGTVKNLRAEGFAPEEIDNRGVIERLTL